MSNIFIDDKDYKGIDFSLDGFTKGNYENCGFINCNFSGTDLSDLSFDECKFENCNFSNVKISNTAFKNVKFKNCKLLGLNFDECNRFLLSFSFVSCQLNLSSFYKLPLKKTSFINCWFFCRLCN